jgi:hypothetical protein
MGKRNPNEYLISTEHEDAYRDANGITRFTTIWTPEMYDADLRFKRWARDELAREGVDVLRFGIDSFAGHYMFDPVSRANCPGAAWRDQYRFDLYADLRLPGEQEDDEMKVHTIMAAWFENKPYPKSASGTFEVAQIGPDFVLPPEAKIVVFQSVLKSGEVVWMHGDTWTPAALIGKDTWMAILPANRTLRFRMLSDSVFQRVQCLGYYQ